MKGIALQRLQRAAFGAVLLAVLAASASAQQDKTAERNARRLQLQMQALQQQLQDAQAAKTKSDAEKADLAQRLQSQGEQLAAAEGARRKLGETVKAADAARAELAASVADLQKKLAERERSAQDEITAKDTALATLTRTRDDERTRLDARSEEQGRQIAECSAKNQRLVALGADLLDRYRTKGALDAFRQREPVLGLGDVEMFNLVQDYRDKLDAERDGPSARTR